MVPCCPRQVVDGFWQTILLVTLLYRYKTVIQMDQLRVMAEEYVVIIVQMLLS